MENNKNIKKDQQVSKAEEEKLRMLAKADEVKGEQLTLTEDGDVVSRKELQDFAIGTIDDPQKKFDVYYNGIDKLLRQHLLKGKANKPARDLIFEEKNVYLTRGKRKDKKGIRGADGRMGYISDAEDILKVVMDWILKNGSMVELYNTLRDQNVEKGYGAPKI